MYRLDLPLNTYRELKQRLSEIHPEIELTLVSCDYALAALGFVDEPPCIVHFDMTEEELDDLLDDLMEYEIDAFQVDNGTQSAWEKTPEYQAYVKYGWMWNVFYYAKTIEP